MGASTRMAEAAEQGEREGYGSSKEKTQGCYTMLVPQLVIWPPDKNTRDLTPTRRAVSFVVASSSLAWRHRDITAEQRSTRRSVFSFLLSSKRWAWPELFLLGLPPLGVHSPLQWTAMPLPR